MKYTFAHINEVDQLIKDKLMNWAMHRLAIMDKIILRMCISEMLYMEDIPPKVSMAEGIEIAKNFSTIDSSGFINGILDAIYNDNPKLDIKNNKNKLSDNSLKERNKNTEDKIFGCTDIAASNYNPKATVDDGNCEY